MRSLPVREDIEWCTFSWQRVNDSDLPRVLLIGDSIAGSYFPGVVSRAEGVASVSLMATSKAVGDPALVRELAYATQDYCHSVIHFNNGLHGRHLSVEDYAAGLRQFVLALREHAPDATLVWATTTPKPSAEEGVKLDPEHNGRVVGRNRAAAGIMSEHGIGTNDLYAAVVDDIDVLSNGEGNVHFNDTGKALLAERVAETLLGVLRGRG